MLVIFVSGMPASGKSTIGKALTDIFRGFTTLLSGLSKVNYIEMSDVVREWSGGLVGINVTEKNSSTLYQRLWSRILESDIVVVSGVREPFLVMPVELKRHLWGKSLVHEDSVTVFNVWIDSTQEDRRKAFAARNDAQKKDFDLAEDRAIELGVARLPRHFTYHHTFQQHPESIAGEIAEKAFIFAARAVLRNVSKKEPV